MLKKKNTIGFVLFLLMLLGLGCGLGYQVTEANKLVDEANATIKTFNENNVKSSKLFSDLLGENLKKVEDFDAYKTENKAKFDELTSLSDQLVKSGNELSEKFDTASKLKLDDKFKEYLSVKSQEFKKRTEAEKLATPFVKSFLAAKEVDVMDKLIEDYNKKNADLIKEADELSKKADQIVKDNPNTIGGK